ncbi:hypothetical protein [Actinocrispum wychmicini]|uniref:Uncharacterized protein n=1 Tax=Actinocrispum wychmicini TaxID=1213861 RepID=A0A4R2INE8_9PSEU|nr:hypothetical protein [Actinocrispum wychmicini]TCO46614.1 hypothetical protein EV192_1189 [Actinocrispum wychmicini]
MSQRSKRARRLATLLSTASRVHVELRYRRETGAYQVIWTAGPTPAAMYDLAARHATEAHPLDVDDLAWERRAS